MAQVTLRQYLEASRIIGGDRDILVDNIDSIAYCGTELTSAGKRHFKRALDLPMYQNKYGEVEPCVISNNDKDYDDDCEDSALVLAWELLKGMAGYCSCDEFKKWFKE